MHRSEGVHSGIHNACVLENKPSGRLHISTAMYPALNHAYGLGAGAEGGKLLGWDRAVCRNALCRAV